MSVMSPSRCRTVALVVALSTGACAQTPPTAQDGKSDVSEAAETGRTINGHTYTDAPVEVKLGPNTFGIPANYLDSQIAPWPGEGVSLVIEWPDMKPTAPGARANPRTNDFRKEIRVLVSYVDRVPIDSVLERLSSNEAITKEDWLERRDPADRLDLRVAQPDRLGLTPYAINESLMDHYARVYEAKYGRPHPRNPAFEDDWYISRVPDGTLSSFIKCDSPEHSGDGLEIKGNDIIDAPGRTIAGCTHYIVDIENSLSISLNYNRVFLRDWSAMEQAIRDVLNRTKVR